MTLLAAAGTVVGAVTPNALCGFDHRLRSGGRFSQGD
jgi:hypothetical protein